MIDRIKKNEERLDAAVETVKKLEEAIELYKQNKKVISLLNKYYGSKNWFNDKKALEEGKLPKIKAGVLSEDAVWNMNEDLNSALKEMKKIIKNK